MAKIVAFTVPSMEDGETAIEALDQVAEVNDAATVYKNGVIEKRLHSLASLKQFKGVIVVGDFPADSQKKVREALKEQAVGP